MIRVFRYPLYPTVRQFRRLDHLFAVNCEVYNNALEERRGRWKWNAESVSLFDQQRQVKFLHETNPEVMQYGVGVLRGSLRRVEKAFQAFFRRCQKGETPGYPRFKNRNRFDTLSWDDRVGWKFHPESKRLYLQGIGHIKLGLYRPHRGIPKTLTVTRKGQKLYASICCVDVPQRPLPATGTENGVDFGVTHLATTSDGIQFPNNRRTRQGAMALANAEQDLAQKKRGSKRRRRAVERVAQHHRKIRNRRKDDHHKLSRQLVNENDLLVFEKLKITNMTRSAKGTIEKPGVNVAAKSGLNREILSAGWGQLLNFVANKAEDAGRELILVDPRHTSQQCSHCGHTEAGNRTSQAEFRCLSCGHQANADVNAACNILRLGQSQRLAA